MMMLPPSAPSSGLYDVLNRSSPLVATLGGGAWVAGGAALPVAEPSGALDAVPVPHAATTMAATPSVAASRFRIGTSHFVPFRISPGPDRPVATPRRSAGQCTSSMAARPTDADSRARAHRAMEVRQASDATLGPGRPTRRATSGRSRRVSGADGECPADGGPVRGWPAGHSEFGGVSARARRARRSGRPRGQARTAAVGSVEMVAGRRPPVAVRGASDFARSRIAARSSTGSWWP